MWPDSRETINLVTFTEEVRHGKLIFCGVFQRNLKEGLKGVIPWVSVATYIIKFIFLLLEGTVFLEVLYSEVFKPWKPRSKLFNYSNSDRIRYQYCSKKTDKNTRKY